jgi:hypothetical protein
LDYTLLAKKHNTTVKTRSATPKTPLKMGNKGKNRKSSGRISAAAEYFLYFNYAG